MAEQKIIIAEIKMSDKWFNIRDSAGTEYGVYREKAKNLSKQLETSKAGDEIIGNLSEKDGKKFLWDIEDKKTGGAGGRSFTPKDKPFDAAIAAANTAGQILFGKGFNPDTFNQAFEHIFTQITNKITK